MFDAIDCRIPNFFTPNGDGHNDKWSIPKEIESLYNADVTIYDSYGQQIFKTTGYGALDGTYNSTKCQTGEYYYIIKSADGVSTYKGVILLLKN